MVIGLTTRHILDGSPYRDIVLQMAVFYVGSCGLIAWGASVGLKESLKN